MLREFQGQQSAFIGSSPKIVSLKEKARVIAGSNATVLLQGATGTGKEVLARYIHANSPYRNGPFVKVDCSTLPRELMESELFGHEKGAFTGAVERKIGMFEQANRGTLFLDEVANLTQEAQTKLLQFLEGFTISRVGGDKPIPLDLRVVAATNVPLQSMVSKGAFREDLYYRLFVVVMNLPVLKDRMEDLPELCSHFLKVFNASANKHIEKITPHAFKKIYTYDWPGNIRELRNVIQRAVLFCEEDEIDGDLITFTSATGGVQERGPEYAGPGKRKREVYHPLARISKTELIKVIKHHKGNVAQLAKRFNLSRRALYYHFERKGIDVSKYRG
jgi:DNA-binding NtrC family response regulator